MNPRWLWIGGLAAGGAALGVGIYVVNKKTTSAAQASTQSSSPVLPAGVAVGRVTGGLDVILNADGTTSPSNVNPSAGQAVNFYIAGIGSWADNSALSGTNGLSAIQIPSSGQTVGSLVYSGSQPTVNVTLNWVDYTGAAHTTNVAIA